MQGLPLLDVDVKPNRLSRGLRCGSPGRGECVDKKEAASTIASGRWRGGREIRSRVAVVVDFDAKYVRSRLAQAQTDRCGGVDDDIGDQFARQQLDGVQDFWAVVSERRTDRGPCRGSARSVRVQYSFSRELEERRPDVVGRFHGVVQWLGQRHRDWSGASYVAGVRGEAVPPVKGTVPEGSTSQPRGNALGSFPPREDHACTDSGARSLCSRTSCLPRRSHKNNRADVMGHRAVDSLGLAQGAGIDVAAVAMSARTWAISSSSAGHARRWPA